MWEFKDFCNNPMCVMYLKKKRVQKSLSIQKTDVKRKRILNLLFLYFDSIDKHRSYVWQKSKKNVQPKMLKFSRLKSFYNKLLLCRFIEALVVLCCTFAWYDQNRWRLLQNNSQKCHMIFWPVNFCKFKAFLIKIQRLIDKSK